MDMIEEETPNLDGMPLPDILQVIRTVAAQGDSPKVIMKMAFVLGIYINRLQAESHCSEVFPMDLLPLPKADIRKWAFRYAALAVGTSGHLQRHQQNGALCYTRFQPMTPAQWAAIRNDTSPELANYIMEMEANGVSTVQIPASVRAVMDEHFQEYNREKTALHKHLNSTVKSGCVKRITVLIVAGIGLVCWLRGCA